MPTSGEQKCRKCGVVKPFSDFHKDRTKKLGHRVDCKACVKEYGAAYYRANAEKHRAWRKDYYKANREKVLETQRQYVARNADKLRARAREHREQNPEAVKWSGIKTRYGITKEQYEAIWLAQGERCPICLSPEAEGLHIDHDHTCCPGTARSCGNCIRGIVCSSCNLMLGHANDSVENLSRAVTYLTSFTMRTWYRQCLEDLSIAQDTSAIVKLSELA